MDRFEDNVEAATKALASIGSSPAARGSTASGPLTLGPHDALTLRTSLLHVRSWEIGIPTDHDDDAGLVGEQTRQARAQLTAGRHYMWALEFALHSSDPVPNAFYALSQAMAHLACASDKASGARGEEARAIEIDASQSMGYALLNWEIACSALVQREFVNDAELASYAAAYFAQSEPPITSRPFILVHAALCYELKGRLIVKYGRNQFDAGAAYGTAIFQYGRAGAFEEAVRLSADQGAIFQRLGDNKRRIECLLVRADNARKAAENLGNNNDRVRMLWTSGIATFDAAGVVAQDPVRRVEAPELFRSGAALVSRLPRTSVPVGEDIAPVDTDEVLASALSSAEKLCEDAGRFQEADGFHRMRLRVRRRHTIWLSPLRWVSLLSDFIWGYGTIYLRLFLTSLFVIGGFALGSAISTHADLSQAPTVLLASVEDFFARTIDQFREFLGLGAAEPPKGMLAIIESVFGLIWYGMLVFMLSRLVKRRLAPK